MKKTLLYLSLFIVALGLVVPAASAKGKHPKTKVKAMTRNLYLGADIFRVVEAAQNPDPSPDGLDIPRAVAEIFQTMLDTDFWERAEAIADEIARAKPHLIGLQEVSTYYIQTPGDVLIGNPVQADEVVIDFYAVLDAALKARGMYYDAFTVTNANVELPMLDPSSPTFFSDVRLEDHDVVLVREGLPTNEVRAENYAAFLELDLGGAAIQLTRGYVIVDAMIKGEFFRFASTHLEVSGDPQSIYRIVQDYQMQELLGTLDHLAGELGYEPTIIVGDFNSSPEDVVGLGLHPVYGWLPYTPPYMQAVDAGYMDAWSLRPGKHKPRKEKPKGFTCCQDEDLLNKKSALYERIDLIFSSELPKKVKAKVVGKGKKDKTPSGLWPSDHAGVVADIQFEAP